MEYINNEPIKRELSHKNIILIGFMGAGKSAVGRTLSEDLALDFYDADEVIEDRVGMAIPDIFSRFGEKYFREVEGKVIRDLIRQKTAIISTGGGAVMDPTLLDLMLESAIVIHLDASIETFYRRLDGTVNDRPMLYDNNLKDRISELYSQRRPFYERAHYRVKTDNKTIPEVAMEIEHLLRKA